MTDLRPDPDALLEKINKFEAKKNGRGKLRIFLGMCAGVGKTYAMLRAAHTLKSERVDVVAGLVETHGRSQTVSLLEDIEVLPRKKIEYRGAVIEELDLDLVLTRKPRVVLIDELAHTNAPGSRHPKRFQDVIEALEAGIDVYTTLNIQHLESRVEKAREVTGTTIGETVPDSILDLAEDIQLIDLPPEELRRRLFEGNVYHGDKIALASENFFRLENLIALRELSLRLMAERVSREARETLRSDPEGGFVVVSLGTDPGDVSLIRQGRRYSQAMGLPWACVHVEEDDENETEKQVLSSHLSLARELGAEIRILPRENIERTVIEFALECKASLLIVGSAKRGFFWRPKITQKMVEQGEGLTVLVSERNLGKFKRHWIQTKGSSHFWMDCGLALLGVGLATGAGFAIREMTGYGVVSFVYLLAISLLALRLGRVVTLLATGLSAALWDFLFIPPVLTFRINRLEDGLTLVMYFLVTMIISHLTWRLKRRELFERKREARTRSLYRLAQSLVEKSDLHEGIQRACNETEKLMGLETAIWISGENGALLTDATSGRPLPGSTLTKSLIRYPDVGRWRVTDKDTGIAQWAFVHAKSVGSGTDTLPQSEGFFLPLRSGDQIVGVMGLRLEKRILGLDERELLESICDHFATIIDRHRLAEISKRAQIAEASEKLYRTLFDSVSHELKTPLSIIQGATGILHITLEREPTALAFLQEIERANRRLMRVIENLLDTTRLESGKLSGTDQVCELHDVIQSSQKECEDLLSAHRVSVEIAGESVEVRADPIYLEHALSNLVANAAIHTPNGGEIFIRVRVLANDVVISVADTGPGIEENILPRIFDKFFRGPSVKPGGTGLGLSTVKGLVEAMGGNVFVENRKPHGAMFSIKLPLVHAPSVSNEDAP